MANLETLKLKFFKDPSPVPQARFNSEKTLLYWNRVGLVSPQFLSKLCNILKIHKMFFRSKIDPRLPDNAYFKFPTTLGKTIVEVIPDMLPRHQYLSLVNKSNLFIAPRYYEGVGVTFLEALARGCVVFSANSPTMNEYIFHKTTGYLLKGSSEDNIGLRIAQKFKRAFKKLQNFGQSFPKYKISDSQKWTEIENLDLEELGNNARYQHMIGYEDWLKSLPNYSKFILDW
jgi:glycosyltransferase involved in cell wall biosynthesis